MKLIQFETNEQMSEAAVQILLGKMMQDKRVNVSLTSGRSPRRMYEMLIPYVKDKKHFEKIQYYLFDDSPYDGEPYGQNWEEMQELFFKPANIPDERVNITTRENWEFYDEMIKDAGGLDVMVIGLGWDGHFCGNVPHVTPFDSYTYKLAHSEKLKHNPTYDERPEQPWAFTMGPKSLMKVDHLVMIVNGEEKAEILKRFVDEQVNEENPSTILKLHPNFTVLFDAEAGKHLNLDDLEMHRL